MKATRTCSVEGCDRTIRGRTLLCDAHRQRAAKGRPLEPPIREPVAIEARFWSKVRQSGDCWVWTGATTHGGYGWFQVGGTTGAHRVAYQFLIGEIPDGLHLDHLCRNPPCVNPYHLDPVSIAVNNRRAAEAQSSCRYGHIYDEPNTAYDRHGYRYCRACNRARQRRRRHPTE